MSDKFSKVKRSFIMSRVKSKNTTPEITTRKLLHSLGYRFRLYKKDLPGTPDITLSKYKTVIFINGCFWHGCPNCKRSKIYPKDNQDYWQKKLRANIERDARNYDLLSDMGWKVFIIWECETKKKKLDDLRNKIQNFFKAIS